MRILVARPDRDSRGKKDWSGAFLPESGAFALRLQEQLHEVAVHEVDLGARIADRTRAFEEALGAEAKAGGPEILAWFGHGLKRSLPQIGISPADLAAHLGSSKRPNVTVALYACSTGDGSDPATGDGGFADALRDALCRVGADGCRVLAHVTAGHATWNPYVREFLGAGSPTGGTGGSWIVKPRSPLWGKWIRALRNRQEFRLSLPFLTTAEVHRYLEQLA